MRTNLKFDGIGYISNQGKFSKYWGVTKRSDGNWIVSIKHPAYKKTTLNLIPSNFNLTEQISAFVAALVYNHIELYKHIDYIIRGSFKGYEYIININSGTINRSKIFEQKTQDQLPLDLSQSTQCIIKENKNVLNQKDQQVLIRMTDIMHRNLMTIEGLQTLKRIIEIKLNNL